MEEHLSSLNSILPFLPVSISTASISRVSIVWPEKVEKSLKDLQLGPTVSHVNSGDKWIKFICALRESLGLSSQSLAFFAPFGFSLFFDSRQMMKDSKVWFDEIVPGLAGLLLKLPSLLELHYSKSNELFNNANYKLRTLDSQNAGIVILSQELIASLLVCSLFCIFRTGDRDAKNLRNINLDYLFATLDPRNLNSCQEQKLKCYIHYFERICKNTPKGIVSFERKVLPLHQSSNGISTDCTGTTGTVLSYPDTDFWKHSTASLSPFKIFVSGSIEDQQEDNALEIIFSNDIFGGNALSKGCVQEQIRFMINPELIAGMLFMASMGENEAIEIVGVERYAQYTGYGSSLQFLGEYFDSKPIDKIGRRKTRVLAMDALRKPQAEQYQIKFLLREANKALCGFMDSKYQFQDSELLFRTSTNLASNVNENEIGIATGNWGCGVAGGDPQIKSMIQWIAASQANRSFVNYYAFDEPAMRRAEDAINLILKQNWTVGELWQAIVDFSSEKTRGDTNLGFFSWILRIKDNGSLSGSKRDPSPSRNDDRPNRAKRKPVWLNDYVAR